MEKDLRNQRKSYEKRELKEENLPDHPMEFFHAWFGELEESVGMEEKNVMNISTLGEDGYPKNRIVLLKEFGIKGFVFYTNYQSEKGLAIERNPRVCLSFFWPHLERQVIVKGKAEKVNTSQSDAYFDSRPRGSKLGATISDQSRVIPSRTWLEEKLRNFQEEMEGKPVLRPKHWGGYRVLPESIEFWQGRPNRLHDRIRYTEQPQEGWKIERLAP